MGRPPKRNLNYSTWDVDVLENDTSIDNLIDAQGPAGFYVYFALCQKAYATDGYFYRWGYDNAASTARKLGGGLNPNNEAIVALRPDVVLVSESSRASDRLSALGIKVVFLGLALSGHATLWMAVFADMGASLLVVFNGLRLLRNKEPS